MAINIKNRCAAANERLAAFINEKAADLSAQVRADFKALRESDSARWDALHKELVKEDEELVKQAEIAKAIKERHAEMVKSSQPQL